MTIQQRLPSWIKIRLKTGGDYELVQATLRQEGLNTVCENAQCPNRQECFHRGTATVMISGNICTRNCAFCAVKSGKPEPVDGDEPRRVANMIKKLNLRHAVITSVTRDDLDDGGAALFSATVNEIKKIMNKHTTVEVLTPDFNGSERALTVVLSSGPDVFNHNLETIARLQKQVRPRADYRRSLGVLKFVSESGMVKVVKSGIMAGMGENDEEIYSAMKDLLENGCRYLTIGQYLAPAKNRLPVHRFVPPETFAEYRQKALAFGFKGVAAGPLVRSSYMAEDFFRNAVSNQAHD